MILATTYISGQSGKGMQRSRVHANNKGHYVSCMSHHSFRMSYIIMQPLSNSLSQLQWRSYTTNAIRNIKIRNNLYLLFAYTYSIFHETFSWSLQTVYKNRICISSTRSRTGLVACLHSKFKTAFWWFMSIKWGNFARPTLIYNMQNRTIY